MTHIPVLVAGLAGAWISLGSAGARETFQTHEIDVGKEMLITDLAVVESPLAEYPGPFSFGHLVEELADDVPVGEFLEGWFATWEKNQEVNGHTTPARPAIRQRLIEPWQKRDGFAGGPDVVWEPDLANAPFRLLAIVNRIDLGATVAEVENEMFGTTDVTFSPFGTFSAYYSGTGAGSEVRFLFAALDESGAPLDGDFTVIFEYQQQGQGFTTPSGAAPSFVRGSSSGRRVSPEETLAEFREIARGWHALGEFASFDDGYLCSLAAMTTRCTDRERAEGYPRIAQIRTNERALAAPREFREYKLHPADRHPVLAPLAGSPAPVFYDSETREYKALGEWVRDNADSLREGSTLFPVSLKGENRADVKVTGGHAQVVGDDPQFHWDSRRLRDDEARYAFSVNTCTGCHAGDTATDFCHVKPRHAGQESELSLFLEDRTEGSGARIIDPATRGRRVVLSEMHERKAIFEALLNPEMKDRDIAKLLRAARAGRPH